MPPSGRQLMSIGASEHRAFVQAKARFVGQKAQEHGFVRRNAVFTGHIARYRWWHFLAERAARALPFPKSQRPTCPFPTRRPAGHLRPALSLKPPPTLAEPRPAVSGRDCRSEFRHARSRTPEPDGVLAVVGMIDGVWQGGSVMSTPRREPCRTSRHDRG